MTYYDEIVVGGSPLYLGKSFAFIYNADPFNAQCVCMGAIDIRQGDSEVSKRLAYCLEYREEWSTSGKPC
ncbi:MAG: hypothetical protein R3D26_21810 [Cyanobacteriota/Melainabacteria group bacterium]